MGLLRPERADDFVKSGFLLAAFAGNRRQGKQIDFFVGNQSGEYETTGVVFHAKTGR
jgi:hypothetical protein